VPIDGEGRAGEHVPAYIPRDVDAGLRERLAAGGFVLLVGDSGAGKSRAAFEAAAATLPGHLLVYPAGRDAVAVAVTRVAQARQSVLWLDDLERYLGTGGLTSVQVGRLITGTGGHRVVIATLRAAEQARITAEAPAGDDVAVQAVRDARQVLDLAVTIRVPRMFSGPEIDRARARVWDPRVAEALAHSGTYGIAEYLSAGPELLRDWEDARNSSAGPNARGAALVAAAIDVRRAGHTSPVPRALLDAVHERYLDDPEHARIPREPLSDAWAWATRQRRATTALLQAAAGDRVEVFDYLVDVVQRRTPAGSHVPRSVVQAAIDLGDPADYGSLGDTAYDQGRYALAEYAYRHDWQVKLANPNLGAEHPATLASRNNLALALDVLGRLEEAEAENRAVLEARNRRLGAEHPATLTSRGNLALVLHELGRLEEAEVETSAVMAVSARVLGAEHPDTLTSRSNRASLLRALRRLEEAEAESRAVLEARTRRLGAEHPDTLTSRNNLAAVLHDLGRLEEAEAESRAVLGARTRLLGAEHPDTLASRVNLAVLLYDRGRLEETEAETRAALEAFTRMLGAEHPATLNTRSNLALVLSSLFWMDEAEAETRAVLEARTRVLGAEHPDTLTSRSNLALTLIALGRDEEAEAEARAVLEVMTRVLGAAHPVTMESRDNLAIVLGDLWAEGE
jgi:hypothetical protein